MIFGKYGPAWPRLGRLTDALTRPLADLWFSLHGLHDIDSRLARASLAALKQKLERGETAYLAGVGISGHNSGIALVEVSGRDGLRLLSNDEEERYTGVKHDDGYPVHTVEVFRERLSRLGLAPGDIHAYVTSWNYAAAVGLGARLVAEHFPASLSLLRPSAAPTGNFGHVFAALDGPARLARQLGLPGRVPLIGSYHHDNHAAFSYAVSPFAQPDSADGPVLVTVLDGYGEEGAITLYAAQGGHLRCLRKNRSVFDSLGVFYSILSSTQGGWTPLSSEGRYMGAAAWGDGDRRTNPYYRLLREVFHLAPEGQVYINRALANWVRAGERRPYTPALTALVGPPIPRARMWNPDAVLRVEDVSHSPVTRERVDLAAATQLVFEDVLFHVVDHLLRTTGSDRLVLTGGTALNCVANMRLVEHFDQGWYRRNASRDARLHVWVPPVPGDAGVAAGAAYAFALRAGARPGEMLEHAFYCGLAPTDEEIRSALAEAGEVGHLALGRLTAPGQLEAVADFVAFVVARDGIVGLLQGPAETGPRALGHRSILANPCNPRTLENINRLVKFREPIRPLAPMVTLSAARRYFELPPGGSDADWNAFNYMVLTARALPQAYEKIPAVIHHDGTSRLQIVRARHDPFSHAYLEAMGRRAGVEVSVNTSLNVGSPIVQTPAQALSALKKARAMTALVLIGEEGEAFLAWHARDEGAKDAGRQLRRWYEQWQRGQPAVMGKEEI